MRCSGVFQHKRQGRGTTLEQWGVSAFENLTVGPAGQIELPDEVRDRYGMAPATPVRIIETRGGVLLVPLGDAPMSRELAEELATWQALGAESWEMFPFDEDGEPS
jgi:bifunctional DNA-binding transcriptional regulator/antitoxin component of YhaV-PrlF toxin-antitoxin module